MPYLPSEKTAFKNNAFDASQKCFNFVVEKSKTKSEIINANLYLTKIAVATKNPETKKLFSSIFNRFGKNTATIKVQVGYADFLTFSENKPTEAIIVLKEALLYANSKFDKARIKLKLGDVLVFTGKFNHRPYLFFTNTNPIKKPRTGARGTF